ncbi:NADPH-dependent FMN reductase [Stappia sp. ES.058]|uniref:NADPH-dependent FMN reductase n=1 Tax=Stappia sp. ES.058 TaxID=1881061 RepID=UPI00087BDCFF|nr:NAD(P)H-dependent oxidoreductase [Stappia sp. ES.058]SDU46224.1 NAD(P)H-dependent FMN reductase [Stappia sp. ES.058]
MKDVRILVFSGSTRSGSFNTKLAELVAKRVDAAGAQATHLSLADYPMPIYNGDIEADEGVPENAKALKEVMQAHHGVFIASPEYNTSISPLLKNTLDWVSRLSGDDEPPAAAFKNRVFALGAASPGALGGIRGLMGLRTIMEIGYGALVIPEMSTVPGAGSAFEDDGALSDARAAGLLDGMVKRLIDEAALRA